MQVYDALRQRIAQRGLDAILATTGCIGYCQGEPLVDVRLPGAGRVMFREMTRPRARALVDTLARGVLPTEQAWVIIDAEEALVVAAERRHARPASLAAVPAHLTLLSSPGNRRSSCATAAASTRQAWPSMSRSAATVR